jgi:hypothetical protein
MRAAAGLRNAQGDQRADLGMSDLVLLVIRLSRWQSQRSAALRGVLTDGAKYPNDMCSKRELFDSYIELSQ